MGEDVSEGVKGFFCWAKDKEPCDVPPSGFLLPDKEGLRDHNVVSCWAADVCACASPKAA